MTRIPARRTIACFAINPGETTTLPKPSLLIADHDPRSLRILEVALRKAGYPVGTATDGADALRRVLRTPPDLLLCEVSLPTQDGLAVCAALRNDPLHAHLPIILMSGERTASVQARAIAAGADDFLGKPILLRELIQRVSLLLERRDQQELVKSDAPPAMTGPVGDLGLLDVFQSLENWRKSALVSCEAPGRKATVWVQGGQVIDAEAAPLSGEGAFWRLLTWETGQFRVEFGPVAREAVILGGTQGLLAEAMRRLEELGRLEERLPLATRLQLDVAQLSARLGELPDEVNGVVRCFDGKRSLREAVDLSPLDDLSTLAVVGRLLDEGVLRRLDAPARPPPSKPSLQQWLGGAQPGGVQQRPDAPAELRARVAIETAPAVDQEEEDAAAAAALAQGMAAAEQAELQQRREQEERAAAQLARRAAEAAAAKEQAQREEEGRAARLQAQREASAAAQQASVKPLDLVRFPPLRGVRRERLRRETEEARARALAGEPVRLSRVVELPQWQEGGLDELPAEARSMSPAVGEAAKKFAPDAPVARLTRANGAARAVESEEDVEGPRRSAGPSDPRAGDEGEQGVLASEPGALDAATVLAALAQAPAAELVVSRSAPQGESVAAGLRAPADGATAREVEPG